MVNDRRDELIEEFKTAMWNIAMNGEIIKDPRMEGATDCYAISLEDFESAMRLLEDCADPLGDWHGKE